MREWKDTHEFKLIEKWRHMCADRFANHIIHCDLSHGMYRSWRCGILNQNHDSFVITTIPGSLIITGDVGDLIVTRCDDMIAWCRKSISDIDYFAEKVVNSIDTKSYSHEVAREWIEDMIQELENETEYDGSGERDEHLSSLRDMLDRDLSDYSERMILDELHDCWTGSDCPRFITWNKNFLACYFAIKWFIDNHK